MSWAQVWVLASVIYEANGKKYPSYVCAVFAVIALFL
jgi:hypothetical protein